MINMKDEILNVSGQPDANPRYTIRDNNGNVVSDNVQIELKTPVRQEGTPINSALFKSINEFKLGDIVLSAFPKNEKWLKLDGSTYLKADYKLGELMYGGFTITTNKVKAGNYYYIINGKSITRYTTINDMLNNTNGYTQTFSASIVDVVYYSDNEYLLTTDTSLYKFTSGTWTLVKTITSGTARGMVASKYGIYVWNDSSNTYLRYSTDGTNFSQVNSGTVFSAKNLKVTSDGEYAYWILSGSVKTYQGKTEKEISTGLTDAIDVVYDESNGLFYGLCSGTTGSYVATGTKNIKGETVQSSISILEDTRRSEQSTGFITYVDNVIITNIANLYTAVIQNNKIIQKTVLLNLTTAQIKNAFNIDENIIMVGSIKIDKTQFTLFNKINNDGFGDYYILGDE